MGSRDSSRRLDGQIALVTGGNSGIGEAVVRALAAAGATVVINYVADPDAARGLEREITQSGGRALIAEADVSNEEQVSAMFESAVKEFGTVDILVNNAGIQRDATLPEMTLPQWERVIAVNLTGQFLCARAAAREFLRRGESKHSRARGKIICISSVHQEIPWAGHVNYATSKGGVRLMMESIAQELAPQRIRVNGIAPGAIRTPINRAAWETPQALADLQTLIPYGRIGEPEDVANAVVWLASDDSDYVTGTTLFVDGGMTLYPGFRTGG
jgi:glucose 1-dehydrogenase